MLRQVLLKEDPGTADLGTGNLPSLGARAQFLWVAAQENGGFLEIESLHGGIPAGSSTALAGDSHDADSPRSDTRGASSERLKFNTHQGAAELSLQYSARRTEAMAR